MKEPIIFNLEDSLGLTSPGKLRLFFVGTGTAFTKNKFQTNLLIIKGKEHILVDCGTLCPLALHSYNSNIMQINTFLVTHTHADHLGGLEEAMLMARYVSRKKPELIVTKEFAPNLWEHSLKGGAAFNERHNGEYLGLGDLFNLNYPVLKSENPRPLFDISKGGISLKLFRTKHIPDSALSWKDSFYSYGLLIDEKILFTSDTRYDPELLEWMLSTWPSIGWIFHDCQLGFTGGVHASYEELKQLANPVKKLIYFTHYADSTEGFEPQKDGFAGFAQQGVYYEFD